MHFCLTTYSFWVRNSRNASSFTPTDDLMYSFDKSERMPYSHNCYSCLLLFLNLFIIVTVTNMLLLRKGISLVT